MRHPDKLYAQDGWTCQIQLELLDVRAQGQARLLMLLLHYMRTSKNRLAFIFYRKTQSFSKLRDLATPYNVDIKANLSLSDGSYR